MTKIRHKLRNTRTYSRETKISAILTFYCYYGNDINRKIFCYYSRIENKYPKKSDEPEDGEPSGASTVQASQQHGQQQQRFQPQQHQRQNQMQPMERPQRSRQPAATAPPAATWGAAGTCPSSSRPSATQQITNQMKDLSIKNEVKQPAQQQPSQHQQQQVKQTTALHQICANKGAGTKGRKVTIETNYLALDISKMVETAYHYDVTIEPNNPKRLMQSVFGEFRTRNFPRIYMAFDGQKNAYAPQPLNLNQAVQREIKIIDPENGQERSYVVAIKEVRGSEINLSSLRK